LERANPEPEEIDLNLSAAARLQRRFHDSVADAQNLIKSALGFSFIEREAHAVHGGWGCAATAPDGAAALPSS